MLTEKETNITTHAYIPRVLFEPTIHRRLHALGRTAGNNSQLQEWLW